MLLENSSLKRHEIRVSSNWTDRQAAPKRLHRETRVRESRDWKNSCGNVIIGGIWKIKSFQTRSRRQTRATRCPATLHFFTDKSLNFSRGHF
ncbi:hypothetical protein J4Q44_G00295650 [Coregonus suidteri]|uniref:Uncharacterized protein n=1 Tax=Coregonus suidteri TaxID=861788 RepID=A0AAN8KXW6_9TELE